MFNLLFLILLVALVVWGVLLVLKRAPKYGPWFLIRLGLIVAFLALIAMAMTGRLHWLLGVLAGLLPLAKRYLPLILLSAFPLLKRILNQQTPKQSASSGQQSEVLTPTLKMTLDHDSGDMDGEVLEGPYTGSTLSALNFEQLRDVITHCQNYDHEGLRLLTTYLQRHHEEAWQQEQAGTSNNNSYTGSSGHEQSSSMTVDEALDILELEANPSEEQIHRAHKRMMAKFHPDRGGSHYMAVKVNQAKDLLLSHQR